MTPTTKNLTINNTLKTTLTAILGAILLALLIAVLTHSPASAWGPSGNERPTFTMEDPATYPVFNSITNNPTIGDERDFVRIGELHSANDLNPSPTTLGNSVEIVPGRQYLVYIYFHNNASVVYNDSAHNHSGVAVNARLSTAFSTVISPNDPGTVSATITADNTRPSAVWDEASMTANYGKVLLNYVTGSAHIFNDWQLNGATLPNSLFTESGMLLGLNALNGVIPGCEEYHGIVTYVLEAKALDGVIDKTVSKDGTNFTDDIEINAGDEVTFKLTIENTGDVALTNATVKDILPEGLTLIEGTTRLMANDSGTWDTLSDNIISSGFNLGRIGTGNKVEIIYRAKATGQYNCENRILTNSASLTYDSEDSTGDATSDFVVVSVISPDCPTVVETCATNPNLPGCQQIVNTGPVEIVLAVIIVIGIGGGGFYLYRTQHTLKQMQKVVSGKDASEAAVKPHKNIDQNVNQNTPSQNS